MWNDWKFQLHWHKLEWVNPKSLTKRDKPYSVSSKRFDLNKNDTTANWVGHSKLKESYINDFFKRKKTNEATEAELTEMDSRTDNLVVTKEENVDEAIPIDIKKEQSTEAYKYTMSMDIENIDAFETIIKVNTTKWMPIYEVTDKAYFIGSKMFSDYFIKECKEN